MGFNIADGTHVQEYLSSSPYRDANIGISVPMLGIVTRVYKSDDKLNNKSAYTSALGAQVEAADGDAVSDSLSGSRVECEVYIVSDEHQTNNLISNCVVLQNKTGFDNFSEQYPTPATNYDQVKEHKISPQEMDGDWVVVQYVGGRGDIPFIVGWWPHPGNFRDSAKDENTVEGSSRKVSDGDRLTQRHQGTIRTLDNQGSITIDTREANGRLNKETGKRSYNKDGGHITLNMKDTTTIRLDFGDDNFVSIKKKGGTLQVAIKDENGQHAVLGENLISYLNAMKDRFDSFYEDEYLFHEHTGNQGFPTPFFIPVNLGGMPEALSSFLLSANLLLGDENPAGDGSAEGPTQAGSAAASVEVPRSAVGAEKVSGSLEAEQDVDPRTGESKLEQAELTRLQRLFVEASKKAQYEPPVGTLPI